jgi:Domain of Unknown Function (DUF1080)
MLMHMKTLSFMLILLSALALQAEPRALFNGKDLSGWKRAEIWGNGTVEARSNGVVSCGIGKPLSGIAYTNSFPTMSYEVKMDAMRKEGGDFFVAMTLPIETNACTIVIGGWGGGLCGISSIEYMDASENPYSSGLALTNNVWYTLRVRVTPGLLEVFLNDTLYTAKVTFEKSSLFTLRSGSDIDKTLPFGLATYETHALWRNLTVSTIKKK